MWTAKDQQPELREEIALLFAPVPRRSGWSAPPTAFRRATTITNGQGRLEKRTITVSSLLVGYRTFPYMAQVFQVESWTQLTGGGSRHKIRYGLTSLPAWVASLQRLLELVRGPWQLEHGQIVIGLEENGQLIGVVLATHDTRKGWINRLAIDPHYQRRGYGEQLARAAEEALREAGMKVIAAFIEEGNESSLALFEKLGYAVHQNIYYVSKRDSADA